MIYKNKSLRSNSELTDFEPTPRHRSSKSHINFAFPWLAERLPITIAAAGSTRQRRKLCAALKKTDLLEAVRASLWV